MTDTPRSTVPRRRSWLVAVPLLAFVTLAGLFWFAAAAGGPDG